MHPPLVLSALVAALALAAADVSPARAEPPPARKSPGNLGAMVGMYQVEGIGGGDALGARLSFWGISSLMRPVHLSGRLSVYKPLDDSPGANGYELNVAVAFASGGFARSGVPSYARWVFERDRAGNPVRVVEQQPENAASVREGWWDAAFFMGLRGLDFEPSDDPRRMSGGLDTLQGGLALYLAKAEGQVILTTAVALDHSRGSTGFTAHALTKSGRIALELGFAGYADIGHEFTISFGGWL